MARLLNKPVQRPQPSEEDVAEGVYLEDGGRLWRVLDAAHGHVKLENCKCPGETGVWVKVERVLETMRLVRP